MSAMHTYNMAERLKRLIRDTEASQIDVTNLINWRATLGIDAQWQLGGLKGFLLAWHDYGFEGVSKEVVDLLEGWRIQGNEKRSEEHTSELQSLMRISYAVFCLKKKNNNKK